MKKFRITHKKRIINKNIKIFYILFFFAILIISATILYYNSWIITDNNNNNALDNMPLDDFVPYEPEIKISGDFSGSINYFSYYKNIIIDSEQVIGSGNHENFPVLISLMDSNLHDHCQSSGNDIAFFIDSTKLDHEIELFNKNYNSSYAQLIAWVRVPSLSTNSNTIIMMCFGNITMGSQQNPEGVWDDNYMMVQHMNGSDDSEIDDSTSNNNDVSGVHGNPTYNQVGKIGNAVEFDGSDDGLNVSDSNSLDITTYITLSAWVKIYSDPYYDKIMSKNNFLNDPWNAYSLAFTDSGNHFRMEMSDGSVGSQKTINSTTSAQTYQWYYVCASYNQSAMMMSVDGEIKRIKNIGSMTIATSSLKLTIGYESHNKEYIDGIIDEARISNKVRSINWTKTEYNNQVNPDNFYIVSDIYTVKNPNVNDFSHNAILTIDHSLIAGNENLTNFPVLVSIIDSGLKNYTQEDGNDIAFFDGTEWLDHEIEEYLYEYNSTHSKLVAWVKIPSLSPEIDTTLIMYYGNSTMESLENPSGVWESNYMGAWHFNKTEGDLKDSTAYYEYGSVTGAVLTGSAGKIGNAGSFNIDRNIKINDPEDNHLDFGSSNFTISFWLKVAGTTSSKQQVVYKGSGSYMDAGYGFTASSTGDSLNFSVCDGSSLYDTETINLTLNEWTYVAGIVDRFNHLIHIYKNGEEIGTAISITGLGNIESANDLQFSKISNGYEGLFDEMRISNCIRSAEWIKTSWNNQNDPNTFVYLNEFPKSNITFNVKDLQGRSISEVNISLYQVGAIQSSIQTNNYGSSILSNFERGIYNITASITSDIGNHVKIVNLTNNYNINEYEMEINLTCKVSTYNISIVDADLKSLNSGWIIIGNSSHDLFNYSIDTNGKISFQWVNDSFGTYNYSYYYQDLDYNPDSCSLFSEKWKMAEGSLNSYDVLVNVPLIQINFTAHANSLDDLASGVKLIFTVNEPQGTFIINLTTDLDGMASLKWLNSSGIIGNYSLQVEFYGLRNFYFYSINEDLNISHNFFVGYSTSYEIIFSFNEGDNGNDSPGPTIFLLGDPLFYLVFIIGTVLVVGGSLYTYRRIQSKKVPDFVKKIRLIKKKINTDKLISNSIKTVSLEEDILKRIEERYEAFDISAPDILKRDILNKKEEFSKKNKFIGGKD